MRGFPSTIYLYDGAKTGFLNFEEISQYLKKKIGKVEVRIRGEFARHYLSMVKEAEKEKMADVLAEEIASARAGEINCTPLAGEISYEKKRLLNPEIRAFGILYNGFKLGKIFSRLINNAESEADFCHIIFTNQLFATLDKNDCRLHARVSVYALPSIISVTGIVEAPAKPREFYLKKQMGVDIETLKKEYSGRFIDYDDPSLTEVIKGYVMQAVFFHITGNPFCEDRNCRLYNAHWQEEVIQAQLKSEYDLCPLHEEILKDV